MGRQRTEAVDTGHLGAMARRAASLPQVRPEDRNVPSTRGRPTCIHAFRTDRAFPAATRGRPPRGIRGPGSASWPHHATLPRTRCGPQQGGVDTTPPSPAYAPSPRAPGSRALGMARSTAVAFVAHAARMSTGLDRALPPSSAARPASPPPLRRPRSLPRRAPSIGPRRTDIRPHGWSTRRFAAGPPRGIARLRDDDALHWSPLGGSHGYATTRQAQIIGQPGTRGCFPAGRARSQQCPRPGAAGRSAAPEPDAEPRFLRSGVRRGAFRAPVRADLARGELLRHRSQHHVADHGERWRSGCAERTPPAGASRPARAAERPR